MSEKTTSSVLVIKPLQYVEESTEGTTPTASPSFTSCGLVSSLSFKIDGKFQDVAQLGAEDLLALVAGGNVYESQVKLTMTASTFLKYALNAANYGTPTGTISATLSLLFSIYLNGTQNYILLKGSRAKTVTLTAEVGKPIEATIDFVHTSIIQPITTANAGLTTPTFVTTSATATVWDWLSGGAGNVTWNSSAINAKKFSITVNRNTAPDMILGSVDPYSSQPHARRISGDMTVLWTTSAGSVLETDFRARTARTLAIVLKSTTSTLTVSGAQLTDRNLDMGADDSDAIVEDWKFKGLSVSAT